MPKWYMAEKQIDYNLINLDMHGRQHKQPDYLKINPFGKLPGLVDDSTGITLFESGAILLSTLPSTMGRKAKAQTTEL